LYQSTRRPNPKEHHHKRMVHVILRNLRPGPPRKLD
jgi:hypothetical protein